MTQNPPNNDEAMTKVLKALTNSPPPEGLEARITARLQQPSIAASSNGRLRGLFLAFSTAWWAGACAGVVATSLVLGAATLLLHHARPAEPVAVHNTAPSLAPAAAPSPSAVSETKARPCASPALLRAHLTQPALAPSEQLVALTPSHPIPDRSLTREERDLIRLTHIASPSALASLNPETEAQVDAEHEAALKKFFTPAPKPKIETGPPAPQPQTDAKPAETPAETNSAAPPAKQSPDASSATAPTDSSPQTER